MFYVPLGAASDDTSSSHSGLASPDMLVDDPCSADNVVLVGPPVITGAAPASTTSGSAGTQPRGNARYSSGPGRTGRPGPGGYRHRGSDHHHHGGGGGGPGHHKTTRIRTVLNEKQLHMLRTCYSANSRPDALMKEQLVEMTGLSPRVIRVWFQNKRCKDKKRSLALKQLHQQHQNKVGFNSI